MEKKWWKVTVNFNGYFGCDEEYEVYAESEDEAEEYALEQARDDLGIVEIRCEDDEDEEEE